MNMILSQTFFRIQGPAMPREYLQARIATHSIWKSLRIWESIIELSIQEELENYRKLGIEINSGKSLQRVKNIVFCQLGNFAYVMLEFNVEKPTAEGIIRKYANLH
jgi:hypothetical protein